MNIFKLLAIFDGGEIITIKEYNKTVYNGEARAARGFNCVNAFAIYTQGGKITIELN